MPTDEFGIPLHSPYNNARRIVMEAIGRFQKHPSASLAQQLEERYGLTADYSDADAGEEPRHADYSDIISDPINEEQF